MSFVFDGMAKVIEMSLGRSAPCSFLGQAQKCHARHPHRSSMPPVLEHLPSEDRLGTCKQSWNAGASAQPLIGWLFLIAKLRKVYPKWILLYIWNFWCHADTSSIPEHAFSPWGQLLSHLPCYSAHALVLHEVFIHQVTKTQTNRKIEREEGMWHWFSPKFLGNGLLVEDLSNWTVHNEHGECQRSKSGHHFSTEESGNGWRLWTQSIPVHGRQKFGEEWHKQHSSDDSIIEVKPGEAKQQWGIGGQEHPNWIHGFLLLILLRVKHYMTNCNDASGHFEECPNRMETSQIPNQWHHDFSIHWVFFAAVETGSLRIGNLLQQGNSPQGTQKFLQTIPVVALENSRNKTTHATWQALQGTNIKYTTQVPLQWNTKKSRTMQCWSQPRFLERLATWGKTKVGMVKLEKVKADKNQVGWFQISASFGNHACNMLKFKKARKASPNKSAKKMQNITQHHNPLAGRQVARVMNVCVVFRLKLVGFICAGSTLCGSICIRTYACACMNIGMWSYIYIFFFFAVRLQKYQYNTNIEILIYWYISKKASILYTCTIPLIVRQTFYFHWPNARRIIRKNEKFMTRKLAKLIQCWSIQGHSRTWMNALNEK